MNVTTLRCPPGVSGSRLRSTADGGGSTPYSRHVKLAPLGQFTTIRRALAELRETGGIEAASAEMASFRDFFELMGLEGVQNLEARYVASEGTRVGFDD